MEHAEAIAADTADRYLLGELSTAEADAFEEHFFDCAQCAEELRIGAHFVDGARRLAREQGQAPGAPVVSIAEARARRVRWIPAAAAAVLLLALGTPLLMKLRSDAGASAFEVADQHSFLLESARSGEGSAPTLRAGVPAVLFADVPSDPSYARYEARLLGPGGRSMTRPVTPDPDGEPVPLVVRGLEAGAYELVIAGIDGQGKSTDITRHRFAVRR